MIRPARFQDQPQIEGLIRRRHAASKYAGRVGISDKALGALVLSAIAGMNQNGPQGSHVAVAEHRGRLSACIIGVFDRVYHIGDKLSANDLYLINEGKRAGDTLALIDSYVAWGTANRKCIEIMLSWSDTLPGAARIAPLYARKGFVKSGEMFEMRLDAPAQEAAA